MAFTPFNDLQYIILATCRDTRKYQSLQEDGRVALLVDDGDGGTTGSGQRLVVTAIGEAVEIPAEEGPVHVAAHLARHPNLKAFLCSPNCVIVRIAVSAYQVVGAIDDVRWYYVDGSAATQPL
jgi:hypothetical protein